MLWSCAVCWWDSLVVLYDRAISLLANGVGGQFEGIDAIGVIWIPVEPTVVFGGNFFFV